MKASGRSGHRLLRHSAEARPRSRALVIEEPINLDFLDLENEAK